MYDDHDDRVVFEATMTGGQRFRVVRDDTTYKYHSTAIQTLDGINDDGEECWRSPISVGEWRGAALLIADALVGDANLDPRSTESQIVHETDFIRLMAVRRGYDMKPYLLINEVADIWVPVQQFSDWVRSALDLADLLEKEWSDVAA